MHVIVPGCYRRFDEYYIKQIGLPRIKNEPSAIVILRAFRPHIVQLQITSVTQQRAIPGPQSSRCSLFLNPPNNAVI